MRRTCKVEAQKRARSRNITNKDYVNTRRQHKHEEKRKIGRKGMKQKMKIMTVKGRVRGLEKLNDISGPSNAFHLLALTSCASCD